MNLGEFKVRLGVLADTITVRDFAKAIGDIPASVIPAIFSLAGLSYSFAETTKELMGISHHLELFSSQTGKSVMELQKWQQAAEQAGLSGDLMANTLTTLADVYGEATIGNINPKQMMALQQLGVTDITEDPSKMLAEILQGAKQYDQRTARALMKRAGISPENLLIDPSMIKGLTPDLTREDIKNYNTMTKFVASTKEFQQKATASLTGAAIDSMKHGLVSKILDLDTPSSYFIKPIKQNKSNLKKYNEPRMVWEEGQHGSKQVINNATVHIHASGHDDKSLAQKVKEVLSDAFTAAVVQSNNAGVP